MEFWGVEVKAGEPLKVTPDPGLVIHISQAALGESKSKGNDSVPLFVKVDDKKFMLGHLSSDNFPQIQFDLVFEKEFELSHNWKNGSVFLCGYQSEIPGEEFPDFGSDDDEDEDTPMIDVENGGLQLKAEDAKPAAKKAEPVVPSKSNKAQEEDSDEDDDDDDDDDSDNSDEEGDSEEEGSEEGDASDDSDESESEEEETPNKAPPSKKRLAESATKTPVPAKKAKDFTPRKTDGKKGGHSATPHPAKQSGKAANGKNTRSPKSGGQFSVKSGDTLCGPTIGLKFQSKGKQGRK